MKHHTSPQVSVDAHVTRCSAQALSFSVGYMLPGLGITILLRHSEVHNVDKIGILRSWLTNEEIVRLYVAVDQVFVVDRLNTRDLHDEVNDELGMG